MSALFGAVGLHDPAGIAAMARLLGHRGGIPEIAEVAPGVVLGCLVRPPEPGVVRQAGLALTADLALYNEPQLRTALGPEGDRLESPGEVVLATYRRAGAAGLARINGEFALVVWDAARAELVLARDFLGALPLYFALLPSGALAFASEYKAILALPEFPVEVDPDMLQCLQHRKYLPSERTLLKTVRAAPAGAVLGLDRRGALVWQERLPQVRVAVEPLDLTEASRRVSSAFTAAMRARVQGCSRFGVALSGGIDSIGVACTARALNPDAEIHTFTAGHGLEDPEIRTAGYVAERIGAVHRSVIVQPERMAERLPGLVWHLENPIARTEALQFYEIAEVAGGTVDLMLTGVVSDGLFAGLPRHKVLWLMQRLPLLRGPLTEFYELTQSGRRVESALGRLLDFLYFRGTVPPVPVIAGSGYRPSLPAFPPLEAEFINRIAAGGLQESAASWLPKVERTLRAGGIRYTSPFFDRELIRVAYTIPARHKIRFGKEKYVLRRALQTLVPRDVIDSPKFPMRMKHDLGFSDALDAVAGQVLSRERVLRRGWMDWGEIERLQHRRPGRAYSSEGAMRLWTALLTELWGELFLDRRHELMTGQVTGTPAAGPIPTPVA